MQTPVSPVEIISAGIGGVTFANTDYIKSKVKVGDYFYVKLSDPITGESDDVKIMRTGIDTFSATNTTLKNKTWANPCVNTDPSWVAIKDYICQCKVAEAANNG